MSSTYPPFKLERYFAQYEFKVKYLLSASDCEALTISELIGMSDADSLVRWEQLSLGYTESQGLPVLREEVARLYTTVTPDDVLILAPEEGVFVAMNTLLQPGDHVISVFPAYQSLYEIARARGCPVTPWRIQSYAEAWVLDIDELERSVTERTRLLVMNAPHNPTGYLPTQAELQSILDVAARHNLYVFSDEMYRFLEYDSVLRLPAVCDIYDRGISLSGLSKSFALPGLRIGWLAAHDRDLIARWLSFKDYTTICSSAPSEILALMGLRVREAIVARNLAIIRANLSAADQLFAEYASLFKWHKPQAGSVAFPEWMGAQPVEAFCQAVLDRQGVMIVPGSIFDVSDNHFRLGLGRRNFGAALDRVRDYLHTT